MYGQTNGIASGGILNNPSATIPYTPLPAEGARDKGAIEAEMCILQENLSHLSKLIDQLTTRLSPCLSVTPGTGASGNNASPPSVKGALASSLMDANSRLVAIQQEITSLISRVEL